MTLDTTLCITIGLRPIELKRTLKSLSSILHSMPVIAINDFGDEETNKVFKEMVPHGILIQHKSKKNHHKALDELYSHVSTKYIFHCEDDWIFNRLDFVDDSIKILEEFPNVSSVSFRDINNFSFTSEQLSQILIIEGDNIKYTRLDPLHDQWYGFSLNPNIFEKKLCDQIGKFSQFKKERHISRFLRAKGMHMAFLEPGPCVHGGDDISIANPKKYSVFKKIKKYLRNKS
ncbi:hypothetical protein OAD94_06665 [Amylibacter sp.]|nr:hypothetical protein [Amylibacter sp.]